MSCSIAFPLITPVIPSQEECVRLGKEVGFEKIISRKLKKISQACFPPMKAHLPPAKRFVLHKSRLSYRKKKKYIPIKLKKKREFLNSLNSLNKVQKVSSESSNEIQTLILALQLDSLKTPLNSLGIFKLEDLSYIRTDMFEKKYQLKVAKLLAFTRSSWFKHFKSSQDRAYVLDAFRKHVFRNVRKAFHYIERGEVIPSPTRAFCISPLNDISKKEEKVSADLVLPSIQRGIQKSVCIVSPIRTMNPIYRRKIVISFGIDLYKHWPNLRNGVNDAKALASTFREKLNFDFSQSYVNHEVTKEKVARVFQQEAPRLCSYDDLLVISFHGHGHSKMYGNKNYGFLVPVNAPKTPSPFDLISMDDISNWLKYIKARHILLLFDSCFSGLMAARGDNISSQNVGERSHIVQKRWKHVNYHLSQNSRIVINAGHAFQSVSDGGWEGHSIFTGAILSNPALDEPQGSIYKFYQYIHDTVTINTQSSQVPSLGKLPGDSGSDLFLALGTTK